jgi:hypothetical protein
VELQATGCAARQLALVDLQSKNRRHCVFIADKGFVAPVFERRDERSALIIQWQRFSREFVGYRSANDPSGFVDPSRQLETPVGHFCAIGVADKLPES